MPTVTNSTQRKMLSDLVKGLDDYSNKNFSDMQLATVDVKAASSTDVDNIGTLLVYNSGASAFYPLTVNPDWEASTTYAAGDVVKPTTQNGLEYVCITAGDSDAAEPTWPTVLGATETETGGAVWLCQLPYTSRFDSTLNNKESFCITVGSSVGLGDNPEDTTLSTTAVKMTVLYRGPSTLIDDYIEWGSIATADQAEIKTAMELRGIRVEDSATAVTPTYKSYA